jgi:putative ABC transport system ATP-binding protein
VSSGTSAPELVIRLRELYKAYGSGAGRTPVLRGVSLDVGRGEVVALVGQSGSGKSTLLNIIGGLDETDRGEVEVLGVNYRTAGDRELSRLRNTRVGFVFQAFNLLDHMDCQANVCLPASFSGEKLGEERARALEALRRVGLAELAHRRPAELSGGQKQRVAIARALFHRPVLLLCDEPTGNLDTDTGREVIELFGDINQRDGVTLLIVTHEERVSSAASRVIRIEDGRIIEGTAVLAGEEADEPQSQQATP